MYCPECQCEFEGWTRCPQCGRTLVQTPLPEFLDSGKVLDYQTLVDRVVQNGGQLQIVVTATSIGSKKKTGFPFFGYQFAWAEKMRGSLDEIGVEFQAADVGRQMTQRFPYVGYGFAWIKQLEGRVAGNPIVLHATRVHREKKYTFPYFGYGYAWTQELSGTCGSQLSARLTITDVGRKRASTFFLYRGFGAAWEAKGMLILSHNE
jgi:hypothetical protein